MLRTCVYNDGVGPFVEMLAMTETSEWNEY